jgi:hypothetical protein
MAYPTFSGEGEPTSPIKFEYKLDDPNLKTLREKYALDEVAGDGPEEDRIIKLMKWVHRQSKHARNPVYPEEMNALNLIELCRNEKYKLNCYMYALVLNEVYLSMGFYSRLVHLEPHSNEKKESHWVCVVYSIDLDKWIMMDPNMGGYLRDEHGELLGLSQIRKRLVESKGLGVNRDIGGFVKFLGKWSYPWYLSKNTFRFHCQLVSEFDMETQPTGRTYIDLLPDGFNPEKLAEPFTTPRGNTIISINDEAVFWQTPEIQG